MFKLTPIVIALFITTATNIVVSYIGWQRRKTQSGMYFALGMMSVTLWTLAAALGYAAVPLHLKVLFAKFDAVGYNSALSLFVFFSLSYAGFDEWGNKSWVRFLLVLFPLSNILLISTNELHGLVWLGFLPVGGNVVVFQHGPAFIWVEITGYLMIITMIGALWLASRRGSELSRRQGRLIFFASVFPLAANMVYSFGIQGAEGVDWSSITFSVTGLLSLRALYNQRLLDLTPIAREKLVSNLSDGMIVLDMQNRIIDANQAAANMLTHSLPQLTGKNLADILPLTRPLLDQPIEDEIKNELEVNRERKLYFDFLISPLLEKPGEYIGRLIIFRDVTERKENELRLTHLSKDLQKSQTLIIEQQRTLAKLEERQRMGRDMHDSVNQSIHSLMLFSDTLISLLENDQTEKAIAAAKRIHESGEQALKEIRLLLFETQSQWTDEGINLISAIDERLNMVERRVGIHAEIVYEQDFLLYCPFTWKENLYWMIMEALNNSLKHAYAQSIKVVINCTEKNMGVEIEDDGVGFDPGQVGGGGLGMRTMRERAELLGGQLSVQSSFGLGTQVNFKAEIGTQHG